MKKTALLFIVFAIHSLVAQTSSIIPLGVEVPPAGLNVPRIVKDNFRQAHPNANEIWQMELANYLADYTDDSTNTEYNVVYDKYGNLIRTDRIIDHTSDNASPPKPIEDYYVKHYPNEKYKIWYSEDHDGKKTYYTKHKSTIIWFDENGQYVSSDTR
jgi:hypothetical protein